MPDHDAATPAPRPLHVPPAPEDVVLARSARNRRMAQACYLWAFSALRPSPGARGFYDRQRAKGKSHHQALRALANRLVGVLHGCLSNGQPYDEAGGLASTSRRLPLDSLRSWDVWPDPGQCPQVECSSDSQGHDPP